MSKLEKDCPFVEEEYFNWLEGNLESLSYWII